jgi:hypothetical protein
MVSNSSKGETLSNHWYFHLSRDQQILSLVDDRNNIRATFIVNKYLHKYLWEHPEVLVNTAGEYGVPVVIPAPLLRSAGSMPKIPSTSARIMDLSAALAVEPGRNEQWRSELWEIAATGSQNAAIRFALGLLYTGLYSRLTWMAEKSVSPLIACLCWILRSDFRTWGILSGVLLWAGVETAHDTGLGAAIAVVLGLFSALAWLVETLRKRFDAQPRKRGSSD